MAKLSNLIEQHLRYYEKHEKQQFDLARKFFRGEFWNITGRQDDEVEGHANRLFGDKNLIYAIADSAISSLLGPNPQVSANARNPESDQYVAAINSLMNWVFQDQKMRRRAGTAIIDAVLCKRGIFKVGWDAEGDKPHIRAVDPSSVFFDLTARDQDDITYWLEANVIPWTEFKRLRDAGFYKSTKMEDVKPDRYPKWMLSRGQRQDTKAVRDTKRYVTVWEFYNRETGEVTHYIKDGDVVVLKDKIDYVPYAMFSLNHSGVDCLGLSEVQLVLSQQRAINDLLTHWKQIVYLQIPRIMYDKGRLTEEDLNKSVEAATGSFVGIRPSEIMSPDARFGNLFYEMPFPEAPEGVKEYIARLEDDAAFVSALAEAARGRIVGAKTATEMAIVDSQLRTRLATREGHLNTALEEVASKVLYLCRKHMTKPKQIRAAGGRDWLAVDLKLLRDVDVDFEMVSYNPMRQNPSVKLETLINLFPLLAQAPNVDMLGLVEEIVDGLGLPRKVLKSRKQAEQEMNAAQQQQMQMAMGGAAAQQPAGGEVPPGAHAGIGGPGAPGSPESPAPPQAAVPLEQGAIPGVGPIPQAK